MKSLGTVILQEGKSIYFASKSHQLTQKVYITIELASLVVAGALEKSHNFLLGIRFPLDTDQKPL